MKLTHLVAAAAICIVSATDSSLFAKSKSIFPPIDNQIILYGTIAKLPHRVGIGPQPGYSIHCAQATGAREADVALAGVDSDADAALAKQAGHRMNVLVAGKYAKPVEGKSVLRVRVIRVGMLSGNIVIFSKVTKAGPNICWRYSQEMMWTPPALGSQPVRIGVAAISEKDAAALKSAAGTDNRIIFVGTRKPCLEHASTYISGNIDNTLTSH